MYKKSKKKNKKNIESVKSKKVAKSRVVDNRLRCTQYTKTPPSDKYISTQMIRMQASTDETNYELPSTSINTSSTPDSTSTIDQSSKAQSTKRKSTMFRATSVALNDSDIDDDTVKDGLDEKVSSIDLNNIDPIIDVVIAFKEYLVTTTSAPTTTSTDTRNPLVTSITTTQKLVRGRVVIGSDGTELSFDTILNKIHRAGLYTVEIRSQRKYNKKNGTGYIYLGIGATERRLIMCADDIKYKLLGNPIEMKRMCESGRPGVWEPIYKFPQTNDQSWETRKYPSVEVNAEFETKMEELVYNEMKTNNLPGLSAFRKDGFDATRTPQLNPYQCIYLPVETFSLCQKPGLNKEDLSERKEKHVRLVNPPKKTREYLNNKDSRREYHYDLYARQMNGSLFRDTDRQRL